MHILVLKEYWVLAKSRIPLKLALGGMRIVFHFPLVLMNRLNKAESADFLNCSFFLSYSERSFFQIIEINGQGPEVMKLECSLKLKIKGNDWLLSYTCPQAANHLALF